MKRILQGALSMLLGVAGVFVTADAARADVVVPPGGSGHVCTRYDFVTSNPNRYWQTCAWADNNEVYFTVHLGNTSSTVWEIDSVILDFNRNGVPEICAAGIWRNFRVQPHSTGRTPTATCALRRVRGAYAAVAAVTDGAYGKPMTTDSLQVQ